jgi:hypothetical protein
MFIPDPNLFHAGSRTKKICEPRIRILIKELPELQSVVFIPDPDLDFLPIPDPGFRVQKAPGSGSAILQKNFHDW